MESILKSVLIFFLALLLTLIPGLFSVAPASDWRQQGKKLYESGQYQSAVNAWKQAVDTFRENAPNRAVALANLALTYYQLGQWTEADTAIAESFKLLTDLRSPTYAQILDIQGHLEFARGRFQSALNRWQQSATIYRDRDSLHLNQLNQVQAMQMLGMFSNAEKLLKSMRASTNQQTNLLLKSRELRSLGQIYAKLGKFEDNQDNQGNILEPGAVSLLKESQKTAQALPAPQQQKETAAILLSLANTYRSIAEQTLNSTTFNPEIICRTYPSENPIPEAKIALEHYRKAKTLSSGFTGLQARLNEFSLSEELGQAAEAKQLLPAIESQLQQLKPSRASIFAQINFARSLMCSPNTPDLAIAKHLTTAIAQAQALQDSRAESYAIGMLGKLYNQQAQQLDQQGDQSKANQQRLYAKQLTQKALLIAENLQASEISYQWHWQLGQILKESPKENRQSAIAQYTAAVKALGAVRNQLIGTNPEVQFSFRDNAEPVYREFVDLLLSQPQADSKTLEQAIVVIDSLQVAELENFFRCVISQIVQVDQVAKQEDATAAVFYPIILRDRIEVIANIPGQQSLIHYSTRIPREEVEITLQKIRDKLVRASAGVDEYDQQLKQVYDWLIRPAETKLQASQTKTLVFILDGSLRNIPMSTLWDGQQFLIEKYAVAVTPGFQLLGPKRLETRQLQALIAGLTGSAPEKIRIAGRPYSFNPLQNVQTEAQTIQKILPNSVVLLGNQFRPEILRQKLIQSSFSIVHLSTHGNFSANPQETFILTDAGQYIDLEQLQDLLKAGRQNRTDAVELLVFSACETAKGDRRATLGLAGAAVRSGASSTLATLWAVDDESTAELIGEFYRNLKTVIEKRQGSKAEALRQAQLALFKSEAYSSPYYWSPFILLGNWL